MKILITIIMSLMIATSAFSFDLTQDKQLHLFASAFGTEWLLRYDNGKADYYDALILVGFISTMKECFDKEFSTDDIIASIAGVGIAYISDRFLTFKF